MAHVEIYQDGKLAAKEYFLSYFIFVEEGHSQEMIWETDISPSRGAGVIIIWVQSAQTNPNILFVRPDCELTIDGILYERKFYTDVSDIKGKMWRFLTKTIAFVSNLSESAIKLIYLRAHFYNPYFSSRNTVNSSMVVSY